MITTVIETNPANSVSDRPPTESQRRVLVFVVDWICATGHWPTFREVQKGLGFGSVNAVSCHYDGLAKRGFLAFQYCYGRRRGGKIQLLRLPDGRRFMGFVPREPIPALVP
jgi:SOS-response transcriptional repressor LexA